MSQVKLHNRWLIFIAKAVRTFCYGFLGVLFPIYLTQLGLSARGLGIAVSLTLFSSAFLTFAIRRPSEKQGPRFVLIFLSFLILVSGSLFFVFQNPFLVVMAAMIGNLAVGTGETGPFLSLEQVILARNVSRDGLTHVMSHYNLVGYIAAALGAAWLGKTLLSPSMLFLIFLFSGVIQLIAYSLMKPQVGHALPEKKKTDPISQPLIRKIAALFALDSFAGGFIIQSLVLFWFHTHFGLDLGTLAWIAFGAQVLSGLSFLMATPLSKRFGLVSTMVFSHLISNIFLILIAFAPTATMAVALLFARHLLSQIDVPTRQTFLMRVVSDHEREKAATVTNMSRTFAQAISPSLTGWAMQFLTVAAPFILAGSLKIIYDLLLYVTVREAGEKTE